MSEWKPWFGGEQPVPDNVLVDYLIRADTDIKQAYRIGAGDLGWEWYGTNGDVIAYRVVDDEDADTDVHDSRGPSSHALSDMKPLSDESKQRARDLTHDMIERRRSKGPTEPHSADVVVTHARAPIKRIEAHSLSVELMRDGPGAISLMIGDRLFTLTSLSEIMIEDEQED